MRAIRFAENSLAAHFDAEAVEFMRRVAAWEKQADKARTEQSRKKYRGEAQKFRKKAIDALEKAKDAAGPSRTKSR